MFQPVLPPLPASVGPGEGHSPEPTPLGPNPQAALPPSRGRQGGSSPLPPQKAAGQGSLSPPASGQEGAIPQSATLPAQTRRPSCPRPESGRGKPLLRRGQRTESRLPSTGRLPAADLPFSPTKRRAGEPSALPLSLSALLPVRWLPSRSAARRAVSPRRPGRRAARSPAGSPPAAGGVLGRQPFQGDPLLPLLPQHPHPAKGDGAAKTGGVPLGHPPVLVDGAKGDPLLPGNGVQLLPDRVAMKENSSPVKDIAQGHGVGVAVLPRQHPGAKQPRGPLWKGAAAVGASPGPPRSTPLSSAARCPLPPSGWRL